jgi:hypothetical protein
MPLFLAMVGEKNLHFLEFKIHALNFAQSRNYHRLENDFSNKLSLVFKMKIKYIGYKNACPTNVHIKRFSILLSFVFFDP